MVQTAQPATAPGLHVTLSPRCPECGTPVSGIAAIEPGRHVFVDCGHDASERMPTVAAF